MRTFFSFLAFLLLVSNMCSQGSATSRHVRFETQLSVDKVARGSDFQAVLNVHIADGWHVNSHTPTHDYLIGTELALQPKDGFIVTDIRYPKGKLLKFDFAEDPLDVYEGDFSIFVSFKTSDKLAAATDTLFGEL